MKHAARRGARNADDASVGRGMNPDTDPGAVHASAWRRPPELRLLVVGGRRIDVAAIGNFDAASCDAVATRLDRMVTGEPGCLHVDCSRIVSIDRSVAAVFAAVRDRLESSGGTLELVEAPPELLRLMNATATPPSATAQTLLPSVAS